MILYIFSGVFYITLLLMCIPAARPLLKKLIHTQQSSFNQKYAALDALRGGAALWVVCGHFRQFPSPVFDALFDVKNWFSAHSVPLFDIFWLAHKAVPVFAVLSGYLIYKSASGIQKSEDIRNYIIRRFLRIYPVFAVVTLILWSIGRMHAKDLIPELTLSRACTFGNFINPVSWSLFPEVCFYFAAPIMAAYRGRKWNALIYLVLAVMFAACDANRCREYAVWTYFLSGIFLVELEDLLKRNPRVEQSCPWLPWVVLAVGGTLFYVEVMNIFHLDQLMGFSYRQGDFMTLGLGLSTICLMYAGVRIRIIGWLCSFYFIDYLAAISYSLFLSHSIVIVAAYPKVQLGHIGTQVYTAADTFPTVAPYFLLAIPATLGLATVLHILVEAPAMRYRPLSQSTRKEAPIPVTA